MSRFDSAKISAQVEGVYFFPGKSIKWLGVSLDLKLSPAARAAERTSVTAVVVGLVKRLSNARARGSPPRPAQTSPVRSSPPSLCAAWSSLIPAHKGLGSMAGWSHPGSRRLVISHQGCKYSTEGDIPGVGDNTNPLALVACRPLPQVPAGQRTGTVEEPHCDAAS